MDPVKREIILTEIEHWRNSKLLPEHYCDFLKNLYVDEEAGLKPKKNHSVTSISWQSFMRSFLIFGLLSLFLIICLYFTSFHPAMQMISSLLIIGIIYTMGIVNRVNKPTIAFVYIGLASLLLLFVGELILRTNEWESTSAVICCIAFSGGVWILIGIFARIALLHVCGWVYIMIGYLMLIHWIHPDPTWSILQSYAIPMSMILFLFGRSRLAPDRINGWLLIVVSCLFFLIPEAYGLFIDISLVLLISGIIVKLLCITLVIRLLIRKPNTEEWITG